MSPAIRHLIAIVGPTGVGKTELAIDLALRFNGAIVNADSRQIYRGMDIGTAKPTPAQLEKAPHHLFNLVNPDEGYNLSLYLDAARSTIQSLHEQSLLPIVVGGTGQYVWGLLEGWQVPQAPPDPKIRHELTQRAKTGGLSQLAMDLKRLDPNKADSIDLLNPRRVIRALEIAIQFPSRSNSTQRFTPEYCITILGLSVEREELYERLDRRTQRMIASGWVAEVTALVAAGYSTDLPSMSSIGYREIALHLSEEISLNEAVDKITQRNKRLVRSQSNWFKPSDPRIQWFNPSPSGHFSAVSAVSQATTLQQSSQTLT